jgi:hypothetical protein
MKKFRVLLIAAAFGTLPVTLWGGGAGGQVGMGLGTGFGHEFRTPGRFAFRQANRFRGRAFARNDHFFPKDRFFVNRRFFPNRFFPAHRFFRSNVVFVGFGFPYSYYPYSYYPDYPYLNNDYEPNYDEQGYDYQYWNESAQPAQSEFMRRGNYNAPIEGISSFGSLWPMESPNGYGSIGVGGQDLKVMPEPNEATGAPALSVKSVTPPASNTQDSAFHNLVLIGWLNDAGKDVIFVQNTETHRVQKITSEPNKEGFRIIETHPNSDPKLSEAVISNGNDQGTVRVRSATPAVPKTLAN